MTYATGALLSPTTLQEGERQAPALALAAAPPAAFDFAPILPPIWDQGSEGACTGFALARLVDPLWVGWACSRRDPYWQGRHLLGMDGGGDGAHMAAVLKAGQRFGYEAEEDAPFISGNRGWAPRSGADDRRRAHHLGSYWRLPLHQLSLQQLQQALWANGPSVFVVETDDEWNAAPGGRVLQARGPGQGLHAVVATAIDTIKGEVQLDNSWSTSWGDGGRARVSMGWLRERLREAWQASAGTGDPSPRPLWEMLFPNFFLEASQGGPSLA